MSKLQARNEMVINASAQKIWAVITDINLMHKITPGVVKATGRMDKEGETRTCEMNNKGRIGTMTEKLVELIPEKKMVWSIENDTMGMKKMLTDTRFVFLLEKINDNQTKLINESYYLPTTLMAKIKNTLMMKKMMVKIQGQILGNVKGLAEG